MALEPARVPLEVHGKRIYVQWDPHAPVTPLGQLVYFSQFLATAGLFRDWVADCPLQYTSPNAPTKTDVLGTMALAILAGNRRYAHVTALRGDTVNPQGLGMSRVLSEDSVRRAFQGEAAEPLERWQQQHLLRSVEPVLQEPWICDIDVTIKTIYGRQQGAEVGYNPHKHGRPAHAYHTFFISRLRLALDVVVAPGKQFHSRAVSQRFWQWWEQLSAAQRPRLLRGDCGFGNENFMADCECPQHLQPYVFRLRQSRGCTQLIEQLSRQGGWQDCGQGWQAREQPLALQGWSRKRRVIVLRRRVQRPERELTDGSAALLLEVAASEPYEYVLLVTNTDCRPKRRYDLLWIPQPARMKPSLDRPCFSRRTQRVALWLAICVPLYVLSSGPIAWATNDAFHPAFHPAKTSCNRTLLVGCSPYDSHSRC